MVCRLFGANPLRDPMLTYCELDTYVQTLMKFESKYESAYELSSAKCTQFCLGSNDIKKLPFKQTAEVA